MIKVLLYVSTALCAYLVCGINPAILISKRVYHTDIRTLGSGNAGFTNFKRSFGGIYTWVVLLFDLSKAAVITAIFARLFEIHIGSYDLGAIYTCFFAMLGHCFPCWYRYKGGKGFLVYISVIWFVDPRAGAVALIIMLLLLITTRYMSLSTVTAMLSCPITLALINAEALVIVICTLCSLLMTVRHKDNFVRLIKGTEKKISLIDK